MKVRRGHSYLRDSQKRDVRGRARMRDLGSVVREVGFDSGATTSGCVKLSFSSLIFISYSFDQDDNNACHPRFLYGLNDTTQMCKPLYMCLEYESII